MSTNAAVVAKAKFFSMLTNDNKAIRANRANLIVEDVKAEQETLVRTLENEVRGIERSIMALTDFGPDSEYSLRVVKDNFNAANWVAAYQKNKLALELKNVELELAKETYREFFEEV